MTIRSDEIIIDATYMIVLGFETFIVLRFPRSKNVSRIGDSRKVEFTTYRTFQIRMEMLVIQGRVVTDFTACHIPSDDAYFKVSIYKNSDQKFQQFICTAFLFIYIYVIVITCNKSIFFL